MAANFIIKRDYRGWCWEAIVRGGELGWVDWCGRGEYVECLCFWSITTKNCDVGAEDQSKNAGCSIKHPSTQSYGAGLNAAGGGVFATQWTDKAISMYFFPRNAIPKDVLGKSPDPSGWGKPAAKFQGGCDIKSMFKQQQIVFDTTFCGQWAGEKSVWNNGTCGKRHQHDNGSASSPNAPAVPGKSSAIPGVPVPTGYPEVPTSLITSTKPGIPSVPVPTDHVEKTLSSWTSKEASPQFRTLPNGEQPSPAPTPVGEDPPANPAEPVRTGYRTVTATVTASAGTGATPTPAPVPRNVRMARFFREHRQKITRHNAKL
ncbi:Glycoside hydrolase family 16 protein [Pyrenophora tritici-repentis]|nr:Glycoside hydrolase family 16 protein [Pyrenophora tritici-repentis]